MTLPSGASPPRVRGSRRSRGSRQRSSVIRPSTRFPIGAASALYLSTSAVSAGSLRARPSAATITFVAVDETMSFVWWSITRSIFGDDAAERRRARDQLARPIAAVVLPRACGRSRSRRPIGSSRLTMSTIVAADVVAAVTGPAGRPAGRRSRTARSGSRPGGSGSRTSARPARAELCDELVHRRRPRRRNSRPSIADGVTTSGVSSNVIPMNAIFALSTLRISYGGRPCRPCPRRRRSRRGSRRSSRRTACRPGSRRRDGSRRSSGGRSRPRPSSNSWLPMPRHVEAHRFSASIGRLVVEQRRQQRARADQVAGMRRTSCSCSSDPSVLDVRSRGTRRRRRTVR